MEKGERDPEIHSVFFTDRILHKLERLVVKVGPQVDRGFIYLWNKLRGGGGIFWNLNSEKLYELRLNAPQDQEVPGASIPPSEEGTRNTDSKGQ